MLRATKEDTDKLKVDGYVCLLPLINNTPDRIHLISSTGRSHQRSLLRICWICVRLLNSPKYIMVGICSQILQIYLISFQDLPVTVCLHGVDEALQRNTRTPW